MRRLEEKAPRTMEERHPSVGVSLNAKRENERRKSGKGSVEILLYVAAPKLDLGSDGPHKVEARRG